MCVYISDIIAAFVEYVCSQIPIVQTALSRIYILYMCVFDSVKY